VASTAALFAGAGVAIPATAAANAQSDSERFTSDLDGWTRFSSDLIGPNDWTEFKTQNWGASNGNGGGNAAYLGLAVYTTGGKRLDSLTSSTTYPPEAAGGPDVFAWNFGIVYDANWPIEPAFVQQNAKGAFQWLWGQAEN
jgi:hypothetical protein